MAKRKPTHDRVAEECVALVKELVEEFDESNIPYFIGPGTQKAICELLSQHEFYRTRCNELHRLQSGFRDPERKIVCEVLACGYSKATAAGG